MYLSWRVTSIDIWAKFSTYSTNVESMINPVSCTYPRVGVWSTSPEFLINQRMNWKQALTNMVWLDDNIFVIKTKKRKIELASFCRMRTPLLLRRPAWAVNKAGWRYMSFTWRFYWKFLFSYFALKGLERDVFFFVFCL